MAVKKVICILMVTLLTLVGCASSERDLRENSSISSECNSDLEEQIRSLKYQMEELKEEYADQNEQNEMLIAENKRIVKQNEMLIGENEKLEQDIKEMQKLRNAQINFEYIEKLQVSSEEDIKKLHNEFELLISNLLKSQYYEPNELEPLVYYMYLKTDEIKSIYDSGDTQIAEAIIRQNMSWSGQYRIIKEFVKTWANEITDENSKWDYMIYDMCVEAFNMFKYSPEDFAVAKEELPIEVFLRIQDIHKEREVFLGEFEKADFK